MCRSYLVCSVLTAILAGVTGCTYAIQIPTATEKAAVSEYYQQHPSATDEQFAAYFASAEGRSKIGTSGFAHQDYRSAEAFCKNIMLNGRDAGATYSGWGWGLSVLGLVGTGSMTALAAKEDTKAGVSVAGGAAALSAGITAVGIYLLTRSSAADRAGLEAASGLQEEKPENQWKKCVEARLHWQESNAKATDDAAATFKEQAKAKKDETKKDESGDAEKKSEEGGGTKAQGTSAPPSGSAPASPSPPSSPQ